MAMTRHPSLAWPDRFFLFFFGVAETPKKNGKSGVATRDYRQPSMYWIARIAVKIAFGYANKKLAIMPVLKGILDLPVSPNHEIS